ncbi:tRNA pseudouridine(55) synthase TruB [Flaviaesturariibacter amylovorans]|uniref:tRNA pseudouridine synthase B n=1 Tax=Flaviaesturariibacter amylovorans TaxID=1084520 RepID=A0ABP8GY57_9BACT
MEKVPNRYDEGQVLLVNKPLRWTSFDAVRKLRHLVRTKKVGHAGTLDPLATGLLIVCTGKFTKKINEYMAQEKEYTGTITLGAVTPTYDLESEPEDFKPFDHLTPEQLREATKPFTGTIQQLPPAHSAIKKDGKRLYELARAGKEVVLEPRTVTISEFELTRIALPEVDFRVVCSTGTYIRSLANDFGAALGTGGYLSALCRTRIGAFLNSEAKTMEEWEAEIREALGAPSREQSNKEQGTRNYKQGTRNFDVRPGSDEPKDAP